VLQGEPTIFDLTLVENTDVQIIKLSYQDMAVDISVGQYSGLCTFEFMERCDELVGKNHLLKRSIILLKAWMLYEARLLGSHSAGMATYALYVLILYLFNAHHREIETAFDAFRLFFEVYREVDWEK